MRNGLNSKDRNLIEKGFTLVELLVVIVILGILAGVAVFAVGGITDKGTKSSCEIEVREVRTAIQAFNATSPTNAYPASLAVLSVAPTKFLDREIAAGAPSFDAGYRLNSTRDDYTGGTCA